MDIRTRLLILVLSLLLPAFAAGGIAVWFVYTEQKHAQEESIAQASRVLAQLIDNRLEASEGFLKGLAASPDLAEGKLEHFYRHVKALSNGGETTIVLSTPQGQQILNTRLPFGSPPHTINPRLLELRRISGPRPTIASDLFLSPLGRRYDFAIQVPVFIDGDLRYYMSHGMEAKQIQLLLRKQDFPATWIAAVVDRKGVVIARSENPEQFIGKSATGKLAEKISREMQSGVNEGVTLDGKQVRAFFHRAPRSEWTAVLSVPVAELNRPAVHAALLLTVLMLLILVGALVLTQRYVAKTLTPIRKLRDDAHRLGRGEAVTRYVSGLTEFDEVHASLVQASAKIHDASTELKHQVAEAISSTERAQRALLQAQKLEALGRLTGGVAHDFNNVLQTLTSALQLIRIEADPAKIPARVAMCEKAVAGASSLVAQLRAFGRAQEAYQETVRPDRAVMSALPMLKSALPSTIRFETDLQQAAWPITVDLTQFELALLNLVMNARDAIIGHGVISIQITDHIQHSETEVLPAGDYVCIRVSDTGAGMPQDILNKAFDPFFTTKPVDKGSGLGLPQAYGFATQSQGTLVLDSTVGQGTTAIMYLPRAHVNSIEAPSLAREHRANTPHLNGTILYVEDDALVSDSVSPILEQAGARVICAASSEEALAILRSGEKVDVLFSDIVMPGAMNGLMLAKHVRTHYPDIAVVLATGYVNERIDLAEVRILTKPYQADDALQAMLEAISAKQAA
jgi:signal transduction histidine kinase/CheY-like chemotaxis protein